jgi:hypothetical protein
MSVPAHKMALLTAPQHSAAMGRLRLGMVLGNVWPLASTVDVGGPVDFMLLCTGA